MAEQNWRRSSYSGATDGSNCVEVALSRRVALVRDSKAPTLGQLEASPVAWHALLTALRT
jgi:hypothetical protein